MSFTAEQTSLLGAPLSREHVAKRQGAGSKQLSYIESHHAIREANRIFGFDGWSSETVDLRCIVEKPGECSYLARVRVTVSAGDRVLVREGVGAGHGKDHNIGQAHEKASKEAESDAQKRALRHFGDQFGLALYDKNQEHVANDEPMRRGGAPVAAQPAPAAPSVTIPQRGANKEASNANDKRVDAPISSARGDDRHGDARLSQGNPSSQKGEALGRVADKPNSMSVANGLVAKFDVYFAGLAKGAGRLPAIKPNFLRCCEDALAAWHEMNGRDQARVKTARLKVAKLIAEHEAAAKVVEKPETMDPATGELKEAAA